MGTLKEPFLTILFLSRLEHLVTRERQAQTAEEQHLVNWAILSTYRDCYALGLAEEVNVILLARHAKAES